MSKVGENDVLRTLVTDVNSDCLAFVMFLPLIEADSLGAYAFLLAVAW